MKTEKDLKQLLDKFVKGKCSVWERLLLEKWFEEMGKDQAATELSPEEKQSMFNKFSTSIKLNKKPVPDYLVIMKSVAVAACLVGIIWSSWYYLMQGLPVERNNQTQIDFLKYQTGIGEVKKVSLPDGSIIWLNAKTTLAYRSDFNNHREVHLTGEAFFQVAADSKHLFTVLTGEGLQTTVLGTSFNIKSYEQIPEASITVVSGKVRVEQNSSGGQIGVLQPNESVVYNHKQKTYQKENVDALALTNWRNGGWDLKGKGLSEVANILESQFGVNVVNKKAGLDTIAIDMNFTNKQSPEEIINVFCLLTDCQHRWIGKTLVEIY